MKYVELGKTGIKISVLGLGFWQAGSRYWGFRGKDTATRVREIVEKAFENNIIFYDTAEIYGGGLSEKLLGEAIRNLKIRDQVVVASKVAGYKHLTYSIIKSVEKINNRLGFKVDLIQHHWPPPVYASICRVVNALEKAIDKGLASYYGLSNYNSKQLLKALECSRKYEPVSNQLQYSLGYRVVENKLVHIMRENKITLIAWSPLAKGALAGLGKPKVLAQKGDPVFKKVALDEKLQSTLDKLAEKYHVTRSAIALAWLIAKKAVPIPGTRRPERVNEYALATNIELSEEDVKLLDMITDKYRIMWGREYNSVNRMRYIPGTLQMIALTLLGGI